MLSDLAGQRILTFNSVVRVNQIEVTRERDEGQDEADIHTPEAVRALRDAFRAGWPGATMTWAVSWRALHDERPQYRAIRDSAYLPRARGRRRHLYPGWLLCAHVQ